MTRAAATARLFVALDPPPGVCERLVEWAKLAVRELGLRQDAASPIRLLDPGLLHLTLCFLGDRPVAEIEPVTEALAACAAPVGELVIGAPVWLPPRRPRALAVEVHDSAGAKDADDLGALHAELLAALARVSGFVAERRGLRAHVTLARMRPERGRGAGVRGALAARALPPTPALAFTPERIVLYRSWLSPSGASYEALASCALAPS